jgi:hypothetical protein
MVLHCLPLPIATLGDIEQLGLELWLWCWGCKSKRRVAIDPELSGRRFAGSRFRCTRIMWDGATCGSAGVPTIRPPVRVPADQAAGLADLYCERCVPPWSILEVDASHQPWRLMAGQAFSCPGCHRPVKYLVREAPRRPVYSARPQPG